MPLNVQDVPGTARDTTVSKAEPALREDLFSWETGNYKAAKKYSMRDFIPKLKRENDIN